MRAVPALFAAALTLSGCVATQKDVLEIENQSDELKHQILDLKQTITALQGSISSLQANQADLTVEMKQLHTDMSAFTETINESQSNMVKLSSKLDDMQAGVTSRVASIGESLSTAQSKLAAEQKAALAKAQGPTPTEVFQNAEVRLAKKDYDLAAKGFADYIAKFPSGALVDVATYNLGEAEYGLKNWKEAGKHFGLFLEKFPKSDLTAATRVKYALCLVNLKQSGDEARQYLESVVSDFPKSPEAKAAAKYLKKLKPPKEDDAE